MESEKLRKLEQRKKEILKRIELTKKAKEDVINLIQRLVSQLNSRKITREEYGEKLKEALKKRTAEQWLEYYEKYLVVCKEHLRLCEKEIKKESSSALKGKAVLILTVLIVIVLIGLLASLFLILKPVGTDAFQNIGKKILTSIEYLTEKAPTVPEAEEAPVVFEEPKVPVSLENKQARVLEESLIQYSAVLGKSVKWKKQFKVDGTTGFIVELPKGSENIKVKAIEDGEEKDVTEIAGISKKRSFFIFEKNVEVEIKEDAVGGITGAAISDADSGSVLFEIYYETPAPEISELEAEGRAIKKVLIKGPDDVHYKDILSFTELPREFGRDEIGRLKLYEIKNNQRIETRFIAYDTDENGLLDYAEWLTPELSEAVFEFVIEISKAEHLDENKDFINDIYNEVYKLDNIWSEEVKDGEYVRVAFRQNLTYKNDITIYPRIVSGNPAIEVYEINESWKIAEFAFLKNNEYNKVYLTNLISESQDVFDLRIVNGSIEIEHIIDPGSMCTGTYIICPSFAYNGSYFSIYYGADSQSDPSGSFPQTSLSLYRTSPTNNELNCEEWTSDGDGAPTGDSQWYFSESTTGVKVYEARCYGCSAGGSCCGSNDRDPPASCSITILEGGVAPEFINISNCTQLQDMKNSLNVNYQLIQDIDCSDTKNWNSGAGFEPIGISSAFSKVFEGNGYKITGLYINRPEQGSVGLFGVIGSIGIVRNVGLENVNITGRVNVGGLAGVNYGSIYNSSSSGKVRATYDFVGGLVGSTSGLVRDSYSSVNVEGDSEAGGLIGNSYGSASMVNSYSTGSVTCATSCGGFLGYLSTGSCTNSFWDTQTSGRSSSACSASGKTTAQMKQQATFTNWDFANIWWIREGVSYPMLRALNKPPTVPIQNSPANNSFILTNSVLLNCSNSTDRDNDAVIYYYFGDAADGSTYLGKNNSGTNYNWAGLSDGAYFWKCSAGDWISNSSGTSVWKFSVDTVVPFVIIASPQNITYATSSISFNISGNEVLTFCKFSINNWLTNYTMALNASRTGAGYINNSIADGSYTARFWCNDTANNINNTGQVTFTKDTVAPLVTIISPQNITYATSSIDFNFILSEPGTCLYSLNNGITNYTMTPNPSRTGFNATNSLLADGTYTVRAYCNDTAGNRNYTATRTFTKDTVAPLVTIISPQNITYATSSISFNISGNEVLTFCKFSINNWLTNYTMALNASRTGAGYINNSIADGSYTARFWCNDTANNINNTGQVTFSKDATPPLVTIISPLNITYATSSISFNFSLNEAGTCLYSLNNGITNYTMTSNSSRTGFTATNNSIADGSYVVRAYCNDTAGNRNYTTTRTFAKDTIAPSITITYPVNNTIYNINITNLNYSVFDANLRYCWYSLDNGRTNSTPVLGCSNFTRLSGTDGYNTWRVYANDSAGNQNSTSTTFYSTYISRCGKLEKANEKYTLNNNIENNTLTSGGSCINITAQNTTFDCQGYYIQSDDPAVGVYSNQLNTTIKNCNISMNDSFMGYGIQLYRANNSFIFNNTLINQYTGLYSEKTSNIMIDRVTANSNFYGMSISNSSNNTLINNNLNANTNWGIFISDSYFFNLLNNTLISNGGFNIHFLRSSNNILVNNSLTDGPFFIEKGAYNTAMQNKFDECLPSCIWLMGASNNLFEKNEIKNPSIMSIQIDASGINSSNNLFKDMNIPRASIGPAEVVLFGSFDNFNLNNTFLNVSYDREGGDSYNELIRKWYYQANVTDAYGAPIIRANLSAYNRTNNWQFNLTSNLTGFTDRTTIIEYVSNGTRIYYSPYTINTRSGSLSESHKLNVTERTLQSGFGGLILDNIVFDAIPPSISFVPPTPPNGSAQYNNNIFVNVSASDVGRGNNNISTFIDFDNSLVAWWRMDDVNQTGLGAKVYDYTGKNNGTAFGNAVQIDEGYFGKGFEFDGMDDSIILPFSNSILTQNKTFTISTWFSAKDIGTALANFILIFHRESSPSLAGAIEVYGGNRLGWEYYNGTSQKTKLIYSNIQKNEWYHVTVTYNGTDFLFYLNGALGPVNNPSRDSFYGSGLFSAKIGYSDFGWADDFNGTIDDVMIFNKSLSAEEIRGLYANTSAKYVSNNFTNLSEGSHKFKAYAQDTFGNVNSTEKREVFLSFAPRIIYVQSLGEVSLDPGAVKNVSFNFTVYDVSSFNYLNESSARANFTRGKVVRNSTNCSRIVAESSGNYANYSCTVGMRYFDDAGSWSVTVAIADNARNWAINNSVNFNYNEGGYFDILPSDINWSSIVLGQEKKADNNVSIRNLGNVNVLNVMINATQLNGTQYSAYNISVSKIRVNISSADFCNGYSLVESQNISFYLFVNYSESLENFPANKSLGFCMKPLTDIPAQVYKSARDWRIDVVFEFILSFIESGSGLALAVAIVSARRKKKRAKESELKDKYIDFDSLLNLDESLREKYGLGANELIDIAKKKYNPPINITSENLLEFLEDKLKERYNLSVEDLFKIKKGFVKEIRVPITIFREKIGSAGVLCKYLKENIELKFSEIAKLINRDERSVWLNYRNAVKKMKEKIEEDKRMLISVEIFNDRRLSILEAVVKHLKEKGLKNVEISNLLGKDQRNVYTLYSRAKKKLLK